MAWIFTFSIPELSCVLHVIFRDVFPQKLVVFRVSELIVGDVVSTVIWCWFDDVVMIVSFAWQE